MGHGDHGGGDGRIVLVGQGTRHEGLVDLQGVEREPLQVGDGRVARPEVVHGHAHAAPPERVKLAQDVGVGAQHASLAQLQLQQRRLQARLGQRLVHELGQVPARELAERDVGGHADRGAGPRPARPGAGGRPGAAPTCPTSTMKPVSSATGMNSVGGTSPSSGERQRSRASAPTMRRRPRLDDGLVVQRELVALQRPAQQAVHLERALARVAQARGCRSRTRRPRAGPPRPWPAPRVAAAPRPCSRRAGATAMPRLAET